MKSCRFYPASCVQGHFRLLQRLFNQIDRILHINELREITEDVIQAAASTLVIGAAN